MKNFTDSDYAVNKNAAGIVYRFADQTVEITLEDYLRENPDMTEADFAELKALSDSDYYDRDRSGYRQTWKDVSFEGLEETDLLTAPSPEDDYFDRLERTAEAERKTTLAKRAMGKLTETQRRRYVMRHVHGMTLREIAGSEGAHFTSVEESILAAERKIKIILKKG
jgi:hypothetical protein